MKFLGGRAGWAWLFVSAFFLTGSQAFGGRFAMRKSAQETLAPPVFAISSPLQMSASSVQIGQTMTASVTYMNNTSQAVVLKSMVIAGRPPGGQNDGGPYDDYSPEPGPVTIAAGASYTMTASRTFTSSDPTGAWYSYPTYEDSSGVWHDGPDVDYTVAPAPVFAISSPLQMSASSVQIGQTMTASVIYTNNTSQAVVLKSMVIAGRPPGGQNDGGPYDDYSPEPGPVTIAAGASYTMTASRTFTSSDPTGAWYSYPTYEDSSGVWHDGPDVDYTVAPAPVFAISSPLQMSASSVQIGQTMTASVIYTNNTSQAVVLKSMVIAGRPPGGQNDGGPYDDYSPEPGPVTIAAGASYTMTASRTFTSSDPTGAWYSYPTYEDSSGVWHDGPDVDYTVTAGSNPPPYTPPPASGGHANRPNYNTGNGFFVLNGQIYDPNGNEFRIRGMDKVHWDNGSPGLANSHANAVRWAMDFTQNPANNIAVLMGGSGMTSGTIYEHMVVIPGNWSGTCDDGSVTPPASGMAPLTPTFQAILNTWVSQASSWTQLNKYGIINIANEWGPSDSTVWRDNYIQAIAAMRAAGYTGPLLIDAGGCGQDESDLELYSQAVFNSDPERNIIFAQHLYGGTNDLSASIASVQKGNPTVITLNSNSLTHPFASSFNGSNNSYSGITAYNFSGVQGMTQLNGMQPAKQNVGGTPGAWTITLTVDSTNWGNYTGGGTVVDYNGNYALHIARLAALGNSTGAAYIIGEFGPGANIGPSPTMTTPQEIISAAETSGIGWLAWAWDDNDLAAEQSDNNWFSMSYFGNYSSSADLTIFGQEVVEGCMNPAPGGCGCPDNPPPSLSSVEPGCQGTPVPQYSQFSLKSLAILNTAF